MKYVKLISWVLGLIVLAVSAVLYLEHRHQDVMESLTAARSDIDHLDEKVDENADSRKTANDRIYKALDALQQNDKELAVQVIEARYCCELSGAKGVAKKKVVKRKTGDVLPYTLKFKENPGVIVTQTKEE